MLAELTDLSDWVQPEIRIGIVSDTHGHLDARIAEAVATCDIAIHAGDIGSATVLEQLVPKSGIVIAVAGNNDVVSKWDPTESEIVLNLAEEHVVKLPNGIVSVEHGHKVWDSRRYHEILRKKHKESRVVVYGHTHARTIDTSDTPWVVNPGASGRNRNRGGPSCLKLTADGENWSVSEQVFAN